MENIQAIHCSEDGLKFDSKFERQFYMECRQALPYPLLIKREPKVVIGIGKIWKVDFLIGSYLVETKGRPDPNLASKLNGFGRMNPEHKKNFLLVYQRKPFYGLPDWVNQCSTWNAVNYIKEQHGKL